MAHKITLGAASPGRFFLVLVEQQQQKVEHQKSRVKTDSPQICPLSLNPSGGARRRGAEPPELLVNHIARTGPMDY